LGPGSAVERLAALAGSGQATCRDRWLCQLLDERRIRVGPRFAGLGYHRRCFLARRPTPQRWVSDLNRNDATLIAPQTYFNRRISRHRCG
jgi:hypothetical protein